MNTALPTMVLSTGFSMANLQSQAQSVLTQLERLLSATQMWTKNVGGLQLPLIVAIAACLVVLFLLLGATLLLIRARRETRKVRQELATIVAGRKATESASDATTEFLASMKHWIRTPVNAMVGFIDLALKTGLHPELLEHQDTVRASAARLLHIADDVLEFSRIEAGRLHLDNMPFSISECILSAMKLVEAETAAKNLVTTCKIDPQLPDMLSGDPERLRHVIFNLLDYAGGFITSGTLIVSAALESTSGNDVLVRVAVTGRGVEAPAAERPLLSKPLQDADGGVTLKPAESGVGLLISGRLIDLMRGTMKPHGESGGSTLEFTVRLQKQESSAERPALVQAPVSVASRELSILVAEDNAADRRQLTKILESAGHRVWVATNGNEAVQNIQTEGFDLIFLDVEAAHLDGLDVTRAIRAAEAPGLHVPIYALIAHAVPDEREKCVAAGMDGFVAKPLAAEDILQLVSKLAGSTANTNRAALALDSGNLASIAPAKDATIPAAGERLPADSASLPDLETIAVERANHAASDVDDTPTYVLDAPTYIYKDLEQTVNAASDSHNSSTPEYLLAEPSSPKLDLDLYLLANATAEKTNGSSGATTPIFHDEIAEEMADAAQIENSRYLAIDRIEQPVIAGFDDNLLEERNQTAEIVSVLVNTELDRSTDTASVAVNTGLSAPAALALLDATSHLTQSSQPPVQQEEASQPTSACLTTAGNQAPRSSVPDSYLETAAPTGPWDPFEQARKSLSNSRFAVRVIHSDGDPSDRNLI